MPAQGTSCQQISKSYWSSSKNHSSCSASGKIDAQKRWGWHQNQSSFVALSPTRKPCRSAVLDLRTEVEDMSSPKKKSQNANKIHKVESWNTAKHYLSLHCWLEGDKLREYMSPCNTLPAAFCNIILSDKIFKLCWSKPKFVFWNLLDTSSDKNWQYTVIQALIHQHCQHLPTSALQSYLVDIRKAAASRITCDATSWVTGWNVGHLWVETVSKVQLCEICRKLQVEQKKHHYNLM